MIKVDKMDFSYGESRVLNGFSAEFPNGITALTGESGCGKTTLLYLLAGLLKPDSGTIDGIMGKRISFVFNEPRLLPWYDVKKNITLCAQDINKVPEIMKLTETDEFSDKFPPELSAGMAQRVSLARALAYGGDILLMDEPFKALDPEMRQRIKSGCFSYFNGETIIYATHEETAQITERRVDMKPSRA